MAESSGERSFLKVSIRCILIVQGRPGCEGKVIATVHKNSTGSATKGWNRGQPIKTADLSS